MMSERQKPKGGRPPGKDYPFARQIRLSAQDLADLKYLAAIGETTMTEVVRRLVQREAKLARRRRQAERGETSGGAGRG